MKVYLGDFDIQLLNYNFNIVYISLSISDLHELHLYMHCTTVQCNSLSNDGVFAVHTSTSIMNAFLLCCAFNIRGYWSRKGTAGLSRALVHPKYKCVVWEHPSCVRE